MKRAIYYIVCVLTLQPAWEQVRGQVTSISTQTFSSLNPAAGSASPYQGMVVLDYLSLFRLSSDRTGGIIGSVLPGGEIRLSVYAFDESAPDGKGALVYGVVQRTSCTTYSGDPWNATAKIVGKDGQQAIIPINSNDIAGLSQNADIYIPSKDAREEPCKVYYNNLKNLGISVYNIAINTLTLGMASTIGATMPKECKEFYDGFQPVIVEATLTNATLEKLKVPGIGEMDAKSLFAGSASIAAVNGNITLASHRGNWQGVNSPENTKNAIRDMITEGYDMVELDLWSTKDHQLIVFHDMGLNKRTTLTGSVRDRNWSEISGRPIKNRFDEVVDSPGTKLVSLNDVLDYLQQQDPNGKVLINLDRSANDVIFFKDVYRLVAAKGMLDRAIFKGRFNPKPDADGEVAPTATSIRQAFADMYPDLTQAQRDNKIRLMHFTPVLFDNARDAYTTNDAAFALRVKGYVDSMIDAGIADGFELNFKSYPVGAALYANATNDDVFLLQQWPVLGDAQTPKRNFVEYVHSKGLPVGIFASVPEVCAIPDFKPDGTRDTASLVSGFVKEDLNNNYNPKVKDQSSYDFRGDWEFYVPAGVDYVISDRPDALREYLKAIRRYH